MLPDILTRHSWRADCLKCGKLLWKSEGYIVQTGTRNDLRRVGYLCQDCFPSLLDFLGTTMPKKQCKPYMTDSEIERELKRRKL